MSFLVVLGMHRCGTSPLTGALSLLGFSAGLQLMPANAFNARGYFEDIPLNRELEHFFVCIESLMARRTRLPKRLVIK